MFESILGNEKIKQILKKSISNKTVSHSYMFIGTQGIGKKMIASEFARNNLCLNVNLDLNSNLNLSSNSNLDDLDESITQLRNRKCACKSCLEFESNNNPDFSVIYPDGNSIKIEQIRELQRRIQEKPIISSKKVYIINDADLMTREAQNCLLKTLEEPPEYAIIILIGSNEDNFLATIKSRCMILHFESINNELIKSYLSGLGIQNIDDDLLLMFQGSIGKAIQLKDRKDEFEKILLLVDNLDKKDIIDLSNLAEPIYAAKDEIFDILDCINVLLLKRAKERAIYTGCIKIVEDTKRRLKSNANFDMSIDNMIFNMWREVY